MGSDFSLEFVDGTRPEPRHARHLANAEALGEFVPGAGDLLGLRPWPTKAPAHNARLGRKVPLALDLRLDGSEAGVYALSDHASLELGEGTRHVEEELACRSGCIEVLLIELEIDTDGFEILDGAQEIHERAADAVDSPGHDHIELPAIGGIL